MWEQAAGQHGVSGEAIGTEPLLSSSGDSPQHGLRYSEGAGAARPACDSEETGEQMDNCPQIVYTVSQAGWGEIWGIQHTASLHAGFATGALYSRR